jgi:hypothetical protein
MNMLSIAKIEFNRAADLTGMAKQSFMDLMPRSTDYFLRIATEEFHTAEKIAEFIRPEVDMQQLMLLQGLRFTDDMVTIPYRLIKSSEVVQNLSPIGDIPQSESVVRPPGKLVPEFYRVCDIKEDCCLRCEDADLWVAYSDKERDERYMSPWFFPKKYCLVCGRELKRKEQ